MRRFDTVALGGLAVLLGLWWLYMRNNRNAAASSSGGSTLDALAQAIYDFEDPNRNAVATRNNNPGNMRPPDGSASYWPGQTGVDSRGFAIFSSFQAGWDALIGDLSYKVRHHPDWTLQDLIDVWAPSSDGNNPATYAATVASRIGLSVSTTLAEIARGL